MIKVTCRSVDTATRNDRPCVEIRCAFDKRQEEIRAIKATGGLSIDRIAGILKGISDVPAVEVPKPPIRVSLENGSSVGVADDLGITRYSVGLEVVHLYLFDVTVDGAGLVGKTLELDTVAQ